jgi:hypothetical protein
VVAEALGPNGSDPAVMADFRLYASVQQPSETLRGIPFPGTFVLDPDGRVAQRFFEDSYRERATASSLTLSLAGGTVVEGTKVSTDHLELETHPSDASIALGNRFALVVNVTPGPGMHVYAPGADSYRIVALNVAPQPHVQLAPVAYPPSEIYFFEPLNERVPTYGRPFTLVQYVLPEATQEAQAAFKGQDRLTLTGTLEYQACDDKICYNPASIPLAWTVSLRPYVPRP